MQASLKTGSNMHSNINILQTVWLLSESFTLFDSENHHTPLHDYSAFFELIMITLIYSLTPLFLCSFIDCFPFNSNGT